MCTLHNLDVNKTEAFGENMLSLLNQASLAFMVSIGHRSGLFDCMGKLPPSSSEKIAEAAGLNERYVREWLGALVAGKFVEVIPNDDGPRFHLPAEHAACLTREAGADNIAPFTQYFSLFGRVEDRILECFKNGGGVAYDEFGRFHEVMAEDSHQSIVSSLFDFVLPLVPGLQARLERGIEVLDIGCGMGKAILAMAQKYPNSRFTGVDLCEEPIITAGKEAKKLGLQNITFGVQDLTTFDEDAPEAKYDFISSFDAIHDQARPDRVLAGLYRALKPGGDYLMQDIAGSSEVQNNVDHPFAPFLYTVSTMHCMTVSLAQGGMGLGTMWGKELALKMLNQVGFDKVEVKQLEHDFQNYYYIVKKSA